MTIQAADPFAPLTGVDVDLGAVWVGHVCGAPTSIVTH